MSDKITAEMGIMEVVNKYPQTIEVFRKYGLGCIGCAAAHFETIGDVAGHGVSLEQMLKDLNDAAQ